MFADCLPTIILLNYLIDTRQDPLQIRLVRALMYQVSEFATGEEASARERRKSLPRGVRRRLLVVRNDVLDYVKGSLRTTAGSVLLATMGPRRRGVMALGRSSEALLL